MEQKKEIKQPPFKSYVVIKDFTLDKSYTRGSIVEINNSKVAQTLLNQKYIK